MASYYAKQPPPRDRRKTQAVAVAVQTKPAEPVNDAAHSHEALPAKLVASSRTAGEAIMLDDGFERNTIVTNSRFFTAQRRLTRRQELLEQLTEASRGIADAFTNLLEEREVWERLARQDFEKHAVGLRGQVLLMEATHQNLVPLLEHLDYGPPPPPKEWVERIQQPLWLLLNGVEPGQAAKITADAEHHLRLLVARLDELLAAIEQNDVLNADTKRVSLIKTRMRQVLAGARDLVAPALVITGASTWIAAAALGDVDGASAAAQAATLTKGLELGAAAWIGQRHAPPALLRDSGLETNMTILNDCVSLAEDHPRDPYCAFLIRRAAMQLAMEAARQGEGADDARWLGWIHEVDQVVAGTDFKQESAVELVESARRLINGSPQVEPRST